MAIEQKIGGDVRFRLTSADVSRTLQELVKYNLTVHDVVMESELSALASLSVKDYKKALKIIKRNGGHAEKINQHGFILLLYRLRNRAVLLAGCLGLIILTIWLPSRILFLEVTGNKDIPDIFIKTHAQVQGLSFGCKRSEIRSEIIKNRLIAEIPELEWVGITTSGCVANISVRESQTESLKESAETYAGNVVAVCDGVVSTVTVTKGIPACKPGQAVQKGQILISGYEDCGLLIKHTGAEGEVYANTYRLLEGVLLSPAAERRNLKVVSNRFTIRIGKKLINFSKDSGISIPSCVKMYLERYATLPGGFQLPVSFIIETSYDYEMDDPIQSEQVYDWVNIAAETYLQNIMLAGTVLDGDLQLVDNINDICSFMGRYSCVEQIGINRIEEIHSYGEDS